MRPIRPLHAAIAAAVLLALSSLSSISFPATANAGTRNCPSCNPTPDPQPSPGGYLYAYDASLESFTRTTAGTKMDIKWEYRRQPVCLTNQGNCGSPFCKSQGQRGVKYLLFHRPYGTDIEFNFMDKICVTPADEVTLEEVEESVHEELFTRIDKPVANANPTDRAVVNLPVIFWTHSPDHIGFDVTVPVPGTLTATPAHTWITSDNATLTGTGTAYDGTDPISHPDHYLHHIFTEHGPAWVNLTTTWNADFTVRGNGPIELDPITNQDRAEITVHEITPVLTSS